MASIDDVNRNTNVLLDALFRAGPDQTSARARSERFPGVMPRTFRAAEKARDASAGILTILKEASAGVNAVNAQTLGRIVR